MTLGCVPGHQKLTRILRRWWVGPIILASSCPSSGCLGGMAHHPGSILSIAILVIFSSVGSATLPPLLLLLSWCLSEVVDIPANLMNPTRGGGSHDFLKTHLVISYKHVFPSNHLSISLRPGAHAKSRTWHNIWVFSLVPSCVGRVPAHTMCFLHLSSTCHPTLGAPMFPVGGIFQA